MVVSLRRRLIDLTLTTPKARIASYLLVLAEMQNSRSITLPVTRKELATFLGMTHETFYRTAKEMADAGLVRFTGQSAEILDQDSVGGNNGVNLPFREGESTAKKLFSCASCGKEPFFSSLLKNQCP